ncbi:unnamed protein product [Camellia sinensis]
MGLGSASHCNVTVDIDIAMTAGTTLQDQKKRTLDALQRRFALAEAELHLQQQKNKKRPHEENKGTTHNVNSSSANVTDALPSSNASSKKGKFSFSGHAVTQDISDRRGSIVNQVVHDLLQSGDSAQKYMQGSRSMKIDNWILLDNLVQGRGASRSARIRALKTHSKRSKKHMSMKQHKKCGTLDLPQELHKLIDMSMKQHKKCGTLDLPQELHKHGGIEASHLLLRGKSIDKMPSDCRPTWCDDSRFVQCKIAAFTGVSGIMIRETEETFGIITQDNKFRVMFLKRSCAQKAFCFYVPSWLLENYIAWRQTCFKKCRVVMLMLIVASLKSNNGIEFEEIHFQPSSESLLRSSTTMRNQMR